MTRCPIEEGFEYSFSNFGFGMNLICFTELDAATFDCMFQTAQEIAIQSYMVSTTWNVPCEGPDLRIEASVYKSLCSQWCGTQFGDTVFWRQLGCGENCCVRRSRWCDGEETFIGTEITGECDNTSANEECQYLFDCTTNCIPID